MSTMLGPFALLRSPRTKIPMSPRLWADTAKVSRSLGSGASTCARPGSALGLDDRGLGLGRASARSRRDTLRRKRVIAVAFDIERCSNSCRFGHGKSGLSAGRRAREAPKKHPVCEIDTPLMSHLSILYSPLYSPMGPDDPG